MTEEPHNHTIRLLQDMRQDMAQRFDALERGQRELSDALSDLRMRVDGNTLILNFLAGMIGDHARRLDALEDKAEPAE
jgi:hypothetical protein